MFNIQEMIGRNRSGERIGLPSFCTANEYVLKAILDYSVKRELPVLIEATCNQVNQEGGYTGMQPADFTAWMNRLAADAKTAPGQVLLGGDHLGPNPWKSESAETAMAKAEAMVRAYVEAGFRKIHLDASMACGGEPLPDFAEVARRAARLCRVAERHAPDPAALVYVIGTEVPVPGGETDDMAQLQVTTAARLDETLCTHREAFSAAGVDEAWERVVAVVTQPGVDFSHSSVHRFDAAAASDLVGAIERHDGIAFEGHSTDYQPTDALGELVENRCFFLKVGPELTFRFREAVFALAAIEDRVCYESRSGIIDVLDQLMDSRPQHWIGYYQGSADEVAAQRHFSLSDRIRYYWQEPPVVAALERLFANLSDRTLPVGMITQYFGDFEFGDIPAHAADLCSRHIARAVGRYYTACNL